MSISKRVADRIVAGLKRLVPVIEQQRLRDVSEADTVTLVKDVLSEVLGFDKYSELTSEHAIRGTYCDLAVKVDEKLCELIEVKAVGTTLNERHLKQAVDYGANQGIEWIVLTNAVVWQLHQIEFGKPIQSTLVLELDLTQIETRKEDHIERVYAFSKEAFKKGVPEALRDRQDATSRFLLAALLVHNDTVRRVLRRELKRVVDVNVTEEEIVKVLEAEVIKRDTLEGPSAAQAANRVNRSENKSLRSESEPCADAVDTT
jgi:predicted type IV restriction endonuclease